MSLTPLEPGWFAKPLPRDEKLFIYVTIIGVVIMSVVTLGWLVVGKQNVPATSFKALPAEYEKIVMDFQKKYEVKSGIVRVPPGEKAYIIGKMWRWEPQLILKKGYTYTIYVSSKDVLHGFSLMPDNLNIMAIPGHAYGMKLTPTKTGEYLIVCNEYCGLGHQAMTGKIIVED